MIDPSLIFQSLDQAADLDDLKERLAKKGIDAQFVQAPGAAEPTGWLLRAGGPAGTWLKGSAIDRELSLKKVRERMAQRRLERWRELNSEILGDLLDDVELYLAQRDIEQADEQHAERLERWRTTFAGALMYVNAEIIRRVLAAMLNAIAALLEKVFGLQPPGVLGRIEVDQAGQPQAVASKALPPDSTAEQIAQLEEGQKIMAATLAKVVAAIREGDPTLLPGERVKDLKIQAARRAVISKVEEIDNGQDDDEPEYERERPR